MVHVAVPTCKDLSLVPVQCRREPGVRGILALPVLPDGLRPLE